MPISESLVFTYNNQSSIDFGVINCTVDTGLYQEKFISDREIKEITTRKSSPYFVEVKSNPRTLNLTIAFSDSFDEDKLRSLKRWLSQESYCPLVFESIPDKIFYCILESSSTLIHTGNFQGYITIQMRCKDEYIYSPIYTSPIYDLSSNLTLGTNLTFINNGDVDCQPILSLQKIGDGDISIVNNSNGGKIFSLTSLTANEDLNIDSENEQITTSIPLTYR